MHTKNKRSWLVLAAILIVVAGAAGVWWYVASQPSSTDAPVATQQEPATTIHYIGEKGQTALVQLERINARVVTKKASFGTYVDSINGLKGGVNGKYWTFYVDGKMANVGADAYTAKGGEEIVWKYQ